MKQSSVRFQTNIIWPNMLLRIFYYFFCIRFYSRKQKIGSVWSRFLPFSKFPTPIIRLKNKTWILSKTYYSTPNLTSYLFVIKIWLINATGVHKIETTVSVAFSALSRSIWAHKSCKSYRTITKMVSEESSQSKLQKV